MNILLVTSFPVESHGGVTTAVLELAREFSKTPNTAKIMTRSDSGTPQQGAALNVYGMYLREPFVAAAPIKGILAFILHFPMTLLRLASFLRQHQIDVVHIQYPQPNMIYFAWLRWIGRWKLVITFQGNDAHDLGQFRGWNRRLLRTIIAAADVVTAVAESLLDKVNRQFPSLSCRASIIPNGGHVADVRAAQHDFADSNELGDVVLTVGQLIRRKGIDTLIDAVAILKRRNSTIRVVAIGDGSERESFERQAKAAGVADRFEFVGSMAHDEVLRYMRRCKFFVLASREEGLPLVLAEVMLQGKTAVATNVDGIPRIVVDRQTGLLVPSEDAEALADAMDRLHRDDKLRSELESNAYDHAVREYTWEAIAGRYLEIFQRCIGANSEPLPTVEPGRTIARELV